MIQREVREYGNGYEMAQASAEFICEYAQERIAKAGSFTIALSGGMTPFKTYQFLAQEPYRKIISWDKFHVFWGDERFVPLDSNDSNYHLAHSAFLQYLPIPKQQIYPMYVKGISLNEASHRYDRLVREFFIASPSVDDIYTFDLMLLGVGTDGHIASLFPDNPALRESNRWAVATEAPVGVTPKERITLTFTPINKSRCILFLAGGKDKKDIILKIINNNPNITGLYPASMVRAKKRMLWFLDTKEF